ncbi:pyrroline-5-carboxylate reductase dimerization-domain-containing protein [Lipomyces orientalis]|uniref:Pyrroline-5-carboxylate reductase dimerization-domain-containing protein n=1 Tax=Lipomyces orientalis TaxID=1233043 RepID=A0ACC3TJ33_9ASCO
MAEVSIKSNYTLCMLACGTMGSAVLSGVLDSLSSVSSNSTVPIPGRFLACVKRQASADGIKSTYGDKVEVFLHNHQNAVSESDIVVLSCKPQLCEEILTSKGMKEALRGKLLISVLAGTTIKQIQDFVGPETFVIRAMPNTPCKIRQGMTVISFPTPPSPSNSTVDLVQVVPSPSVRQTVEWIFSQIGRAIFLEEKHLDTCTALSGSGPAFACVMLEAMTDGGVMMGLPFAVAQELAAQTMQGAARMVLDGNHPAQIRNSVSTPGGCTIGGLLVMEDGKIRSTIARAIQEAANIAASLGKKK